MEMPKNNFRHSGMNWKISLLVLTVGYAEQFLALIQGCCYLAKMTKRPSFPASHAIHFLLSVSYITVLEGFIGGVIEREYKYVDWYFHREEI